MTTIANIVPAETTFFDANGVPLAGGSVYFYLQGTTTPKNTWQDYLGTVLNTNPVVLDSGGRANIWGTGLYRQVVKDSLANTIWDQNVFAGDASSVLDTLGSTQGSVVYRAAGGWTALGPSTAGLALTTEGSNANPVWGFPTGAYIAQQIFSVAGTATYTPTTGANSAMILVVGGGGGGGGCASTASNQNSIAQSGGGGGWAIKRVTSVSSQTVTVGAAGTAGAAAGNGGSGGTSSFGAIVSATGGAGGVTVAAAAPIAVTVGPASGGIGSSGDLNAAGNASGLSYYIAAGSVTGGNGGGSYFGGGGTGASSITGSSGTAGRAPGGGGAGAANAQSQGAGLAGSAGAAGIVVVWEYA